MNIEIEYVCPAKPKFRVGDVVTIPEASPEITYVIRESIDFGPSTGIVYLSETNYRRGEEIFIMLMIYMSQMT